MNVIAYILSATLCAGFLAEALPMSVKQNSLAVKTCAGQTIILDLGPSNPAPTPPHKLKPCHAICCSDEEDGSPSEKAEA